MAEPSCTTQASAPGADPVVDLAALSADLTEQLRTTARTYCAALAELEPLVDRLADLEGRLRAARHRAGVYHDARPPARELATEVLLGHVQALRPFVSFVGSESLERAERALTSPAST